MVVNEKSTAWLILDFEDRDGQPITPDELSYRIDAGDESILAETPIGAAEEVVIELTPDQNKILTAYEEERYQENTVTVIATLSSNKQQTAEFKYKIQNLRYIS